MAARRGVTPVTGSVSSGSFELTDKLGTPIGRQFPQFVHTRQEGGRVQQEQPDDADRLQGLRQLAPVALPLPGSPLRPEPGQSDSRLQFCSGGHFPLNILK